MSLTSSTEMVRKAFASGYAVPAFNTQGGDYHICRAIVEAAEEERSAVILMAYEKNLAYTGYEGFIAVTRELACNSKAPVSIHLDHAGTIESIERAIKTGFTSVMIDYSTRTLDENIAVTQYVRDMIGDSDISLETEIGELQRIADETGTTPQNLVDPKDVQRYLRYCKPDMLAIGIGNAHGFYKGVPNIRVDLLQEISAIAGDLPLVLHGSTGIPEDVVRTCLRSGIAKVNFGTAVRWKFLEYMKEAIQSPLADQGHIWKIHQAAMIRLKEDIRHVIRLCGSQGSADCDE